MTQVNQKICAFFEIFSDIINSTFERSFSQILQDSLQARYLKDILKEL